MSREPSANPQAKPDRTVYRVMLRISTPSGIDFQNPDLTEYATAEEALDALALTPRLTSQYRAWVATRTDFEGRAWTRRVIAEHEDVLP